MRKTLLFSALCGALLTSVAVAQDAATPTADAVAALFQKLSALPEDDIDGRQKIRDEIKALVDAAAAVPTVVEEAPTIPGDIQAALDKGDAKSLIERVRNPSFNISHVEPVVPKMIELIVAHAKPLPASDATGNKQAYEALALLDASNRTYAAKRDQYAEAEKQARHSVLKRYKAEKDEFRGITFYEHVNEPRYADTRSYLQPYLGAKDGNVFMRLKAHFTGDSWLFVESVQIKIDDEVLPLPAFSSWERDHDSEVWEWSDVMVNAEIRQILTKILDAKDVTLRFNGQKYRHDMKLRDADRQTIRDAFLAEEALKSQ